MTNPWIRPNDPLVIAHRGYSSRAPENTMPAYKLAVEAGAQMIEADVNITRDGVPIMIHDWHLGRTVKLDAAVHDLLLSDLQDVDAGSWFSQEFAGVHVPTTQQLLEFAKETGVKTCFEVKGADSREAIRIAEVIVALFSRHDAFGWAFMSSYWHEALSAARDLSPQLLLAPERLPDDTPPNISDVIRQAKALKAEVIQIRYDFITGDLLAALHQEGIAVWAWPTTSHESILSVLEAGADGVMGDDTALETELTSQFRQTNKQAFRLNN